MRHPHLDAMVIFGVALLSSIFGNVLSQLSDGDQGIAADKIGIIDSVVRVAALLLPQNAEQKKAPEGDEITYGTIAAFPRCPSTCAAAWMGDGWCDTECATNDCGNDGGDCEGWCAGDCKPAWVGDGFCDIDCFREECEWDKNDCAGNYTTTQLHHPLPSHTKFDYSVCPEACNRELLHDGGCDGECNLVECNFDGGDCYHQCAPYCANAWLGDNECDVVCNVEACGFDKGDCKICSPGCSPQMMGNGICDTTCDTGECESDVGDCYGVCWVADKIDYNTEPFFYPHCRTEWRGDGYCDCFCMNEVCDFDHGDCAGYDCSLEFSLLNELNRKMNSTDFPFLMPSTSPVTEMTVR